MHFQHRTVGYVAALMAVWLYLSLRAADKPVRLVGIHVIGLVAIQITLGVITVVSCVALLLAALHQILALGLFACALWWSYALNSREIAA